MFNRAVSAALLAASIALAQAGLPQFGVLVGGTVNSPVIINNSSHRILAYTLSFDKGNGASYRSLYSMLGQLRRQPLSSTGIAPGANFPHPVGQAVQVQDAGGKSPVAGATAVSLDSVLFDDGTLVGPDHAGSFDKLLARVQAEKDVHAILTSTNGTASSWATLEGFASSQPVIAVPPGHSRNYERQYLLSFKTYAAELLRVRQRQGDAAALQLAHSSDVYPAIIRGGE